MRIWIQTIRDIGFDLVLPRRQPTHLIISVVIRRCLEMPSIPLDNDLDVIEICFLISVIETQLHSRLLHPAVNKAAGPSLRNSAKVSEVVFSFGHQLDAVAETGVQSTFVS